MMKRIFMPVLALLFLIATTATLTACNTFEGAGRDIEQGGKAIKDEANEQR